MRTEKPFNNLTAKDQAFFIECYGIHLDIKGPGKIDTLRRCFVIGNPVCILDFDQKILNISQESIDPMKVILRSYLKL